VAALLISLALFGAAWLVHAVWWRSRPPARHLRALAWLFAIVPLVVLPFLPVLPLEIPAVLALYAGIAASYLILYTGIEQISPTLIVVRELARAQGSGCSEEELAQLMTDDLLLRPRMQALVTDGLLAPSGSGWALTARGYRAARVAEIVAKLFDIREVG
jgi:hypothetical protein